MTKLVIGCNYHTTWQRRPGMRFVLIAINGDRVTLETRTTGKVFTTNIEDLIFIETPYNHAKARKLAKKPVHFVAQEN